MIYTRSGADALAQRETVISPGTGIAHWGTVFFGPRTSHASAPGPQAAMSEALVLEYPREQPWHALRDTY